jgi:hypothetical protein
MEKETFGSTNQYKMLDYLTEQISVMHPRRKSYICSVIANFNLAIKKTSLINDKLFRNYLIDLIHNDYKEKINEFMVDKYDEKVITYLINYFKAKKNNSIIK